MRWALVPLLVWSLLVAGCQGRIGEPGTSGGGATAVERGDPNGGGDPSGGTDGTTDGEGRSSGSNGLCDLEAGEVPSQPLRRLTPEQYARTVQDLLGDPGFTPGLDDDEAILTERGVRQLRSAAEEALARRASWTSPVFPCDLASGDDACVEAFLDGFVTRAFRRPPTDEERAWLVGLHGDVQTELDFAAAMEVLLQVVLQAPALVYVHEGSDPANEVAPGVRRLTDYELATRLSYFLWDTAPDAELLAAAGSGALSAADGLRRQAERLLAHERARSTVTRLVWRWLQLEGGRLHHALEDSDKDPERFPEYDADLQQAMRTEMEAFVTEVLLEGDANFASLLTSPRAYVNGPLASLYGVAGGPADAETWQWVDLPAEQRGGLLTRAAFLTVFATATVQAPIRRGVFVLEEMLCNELGDPPPDVDDTPPTGGEVEDGEGGTVVRSVREDIEVRTSGSPCNTCHQVINPVGFTFEHYDAIGRWQDQELGTGVEIDSSGALIGSDVDGELAGAVELSERLASSRRARRCFARRWTTRALGSGTEAVDACTAPDATNRFVETGDVRELILGIVESEAFRLVRFEEEATP